jgi:hypothetical protein
MLSRHIFNPVFIKELCSGVCRCEYPYCIAKSLLKFNLFFHENFMTVDILLKTFYLSVH